LPLALLEEPYDRLFWGATAIALAIALASVLKWILATWRQSRLLRPTGHDPAPPAGSPHGAAAMRLSGHPSKAAANKQPDALLAELERTRAEFERAERAPRGPISSGRAFSTKRRWISWPLSSDPTSRPSKSTDQPQAKRARSVAPGRPPACHLGDQYFLVDLSSPARACT
jgi:hypothetical protein